MLRLASNHSETAGAGSSVNRCGPRCGRVIRDTPAITVNVDTFLFVWLSVQGETPRVRCWSTPVRGANRSIREPMSFSQSSTISVSSPMTPAI